MLHHLIWAVANSSSTYLPELQSIGGFYHLDGSPCKRRLEDTPLCHFKLTIWQPSSIHVGILARASDPRHGGRRDRLLARPRHLREVPQGRRTPLGRGEERERLTFCNAQTEVGNNDGDFDLG